MARQNLLAAADAAAAVPGPGPRARHRRGGVGGWRDAAEAMFIPYDEALGVHPQAEGFTRHQVWDFAAHCRRSSTRCCCISLLRPVPQAGGQAGRPGAGHAPVRGRVHRRAEGQELRLLRAAHGAGLLAVGVHPGGDGRRGRAAGLAFDYLGEAALMDLRDLENNTRDGVHIASLAGSLGRPGRRLRRACAIGTAPSASRRGSPRRSPGSRSLSHPRAAAARRGHPRGGHVPGRPTASRWGSCTMTEGGAHRREAAGPPDPGDVRRPSSRAAAGAGTHSPPVYRERRVIKQLAPAQADAQPPEPINLAEHQIRENRSSTDSRTSTTSPHDRPHAAT